MNVFDDIQFYLFNHHHYIDEPADSDRYDSTWVNYPNGNFDPEVAHELYQRWTREMLLAEELGFDAIAVNEHHQTIYSHAARDVGARGLPRRADQAREDPRRGRADQPVVALARRRGVRDARRDVQRADGVRLPAGHGHGVLVQRRPAQPDHGPRALPREPRR